jgi:hypothetical protein
MENKINIWDKIDLEDSKDNPLGFLKEQAELLNTTTSQVLEAEVVLTEAFDQESDEMVLIYQFYVYAPFLGNFRVNLFNVVQPNKPYPIQIKDKVTNSSKVSAKDFGEFVNAVNSILEKPDVQNLIKSLYSQSTTIDKKS